MPRISISYRRDDSDVITGRIFDRLAAHYGREAVFRDIDSIPPGVDFRQHVGTVLGQSDIVLAIVGPRWVGHRGGTNRLAEESDPVRVEIETALRKGVPLIPVLVLRAGMPRVAQLPDSLKDFAYRNAVQVDAGQDFDVHIGRLIAAMDRILAPLPGAPAPTPTRTEAAAAPVATLRPHDSDAGRQTRPDRKTAAPPLAARLARAAGLLLAGAVLGIGAMVAGDRYLHDAGWLTYRAPGGGDLETARQAAEADARKAQDLLAATRNQAEQDRRALRDQLAAAREKADAEIRRLNDRIKALGDQLASAPVPAPAAPAPAEAVDAKGSGDDGREIQRALHVLGQFDGKIDGVYGPDTRVAIMRFQSFEGAPETGTLSDAQHRALLGMAQHLSGLLDRPAVSPKGTAASSVAGSAERYAKAQAFETGKGARRDPAEAAYWYALAAAEGDGRALTDLGTLVARGQGVAAADLSGAVLLWRAAAARGEAIAMYNLGAAYEHGIGVAADRAMARLWYERAAAGNNAEARTALKRLGS